MVRTSRSWLFGFSLLATLTLSGQSLAWALKSRLIAQAPSTFTLPESVPDGTTIRIDGSSSMEVINQSLEAQFEERYDGTTVELLANGSDAALQSLLDGDIELAAIGRPLTAEEKAQGLREALISREKIAIVVGPDSPFDENLTFEQFAQIFRGEITDWSELGGEPGEIRFVDRPESSDTRAAFQNYPVFQAAPFETGATADPVDADETRAVIEALGDDGVGYAIASQVLDNESVKIVPMHKTLPDDPRYPFSQPRGYVYLGEPSPAVQAFLGFATSPDGQAAVAEARETEALEAGGTAPIEGLTAISPDGEMTARITDLGQIILEDAGGAEISALAGITGSIAALKFSPDSQSLALATEDGTVQVWGIDGRPLGDPFTVDAPTPLDFQFTNDNKGIAFTGAEGPQLFDFQGNPLAAAGRRIPFWWWLLPLALLGLLMWALLRGREQEQPAATAAATPPEPDIAPPGNASAEMPEVATVTPPDLGPDPAVLDGAEPQLSSRAHTVINEDREHPFSFTGADAGLAAGVTGGLAAGAMALGRETPDEPDTPGLSLDDVPEADALPLVEVGADTSLQPTADASVPAMPEPSIVESPVVEPPVVESPVTEPPGVAPPVVEPPLAAAPVADEPVADEPGVEEPVATEANVEEPAIAETSDLDWGAAALAGGTVLGATAAAAQLNPDRRPMPGDVSDEQSAVEAAKYDAGAEELDMETLATVDEGLSDLPDGYGESRIVLMPRDPQWAYTYWDVPGEHREAVRRQGGRQLA
ncbi:MAG: substrate-binding domain-containing protein, partial [Cyanobacteria bacterium J06635_1]